jgi:hypothetical protein
MISDHCAAAAVAPAATADQSSETVIPPAAGGHVTGCDYQHPVFGDFGR